ncbi:MAG: DsrE family protein [Nitrospirota bacterium]|nr:DsrE family protein [Nitrospirota bacterium]
MKLALVIHSDDPETVWNAFRLGVFALKEGDAVTVFLLGRGVEAERLDTERFPVTEQIQKFVHGGGAILACGTCLEARGKGGTDVCPVSTMADLHRLVTGADRVLTF